MTRLLTLHDRLFARAEAALAPWLLPTLARLVFAGVLLVYFWTSASTKLGPGPFGFLMPSAGAYAQIFPITFESVGYDTSRLSSLYWAVAVAGTVAEFLLPCLIVAGLFTRLAALGMIGFVAVQSYVDITGHMADTRTIGRWFDSDSMSQIVDQRALWLVLLAILVLRGAGPLSADRLISGRLRP